MLSRSAQGLYWMGRYLERAERLCRLLRLQVETLVDRPIREIYSGWSRIYASLNREPPVGGLELGANDDLTLADSSPLADDLTFERTNPDSVWSSFAKGRENARQTRHCISSEMWTCLNLAYLRVQELSIGDIWRVSPERFYAEIVRDLDTFAGVAEATMYRGEGWNFLQLGRHIERVQLSVALLLAQIATDRSQDEAYGADWTSLLHLHQAFDAYGRSYSIEVQPDRVLDLLVGDPLLPGSLCRSLDSVASELAAIPPGPASDAEAALQRLASRLCSLVRNDWPDTEDRQELLEQVGEQSRNLHRGVSAAYVDYDTADTS